VPRKSAAELQIVPIERHLPRIKAPASLDQAERQLFEKIVAQCPPMHFHQSDESILISYVQCIVLCDLAYQAALTSPDQVQAWERATKMLVALSVKLRLNPHSRVDPRTLTRSHLGLSHREHGVTQETLAAVRDGARRWRPKG
jgi:hypothetical protein